MRIFCPYCMTPAEEGRPCESCGRLPESYLAPEHHLPPGTLLRDRYLLSGALGEGGFGITYLAWDRERDLAVAVKEFFPRERAFRTGNSSRVQVHMGSDAALFAEGKEKFLREAELLSGLVDVPQVIQVRSCFEANNTAYIIMDYAQGPTLTQWVRSSGPIGAEELLEKMAGVFHALTRLHGLGLIHRDISPDNMILEKGSIRLLDFGCAREVSRGTTLSMTLRHGYAPVEQYQPMGQGPWTDVYALSATLYFCLTGIDPPHALDRLCEDTLVIPSRLGAAISHRQEQALLYGLGVRPRRRFQSVEAMAKEIYPAPGPEV